MAANTRITQTLTDDEMIILRAKFNSKINKETGIRPVGEHYRHLTEDCWDWNGTRGEYGHGGLYCNLSKNLGITSAHRLSMYLFKPLEWKDELYVLHSCDRPQCVNPAHLRMGTQQENIQEAGDRGRISGTNNGNAKFTNEQIQEIIALRKRGNFYDTIAQRFNCNRRTIEKICLGKKGYSAETITDVPKLAVKRHDDAKIAQIIEIRKTNTIAKTAEICEVSTSFVKNVLAGKTKYDLPTTPEAPPTVQNEIEPDVRRLRDEGKGVTQIAKELGKNFRTVKKVFDALN